MGDGTLLPGPAVSCKEAPQMRKTPANPHPQVDADRKTRVPEWPLHEVKSFIACG